MTAVETVMDVINRHGRNPPVDVEALAKDLSIPVIHDRNLPFSISGKIKRTSDLGGGSGFVIYVNENHAENRKRFTIAHEIAHYALHRDLIENELQDNEMYRSGNEFWDIYETQANQLAAEILMPAAAVRSIYRNNKSIISLSNYFNVSVDAARVRAKNLRLGP